MSWETFQHADSATERNQLLVPEMRDWAAETLMKRSLFAALCCRNRHNSPDFQPKKKCSVEPRAECSSTKRTTNIDADQDHVNLSPMVRHLVESMTEEHWRIVCEALHVPGTKEDVSQLCACIVAKVVRTTHYYLIPALRKVLGVPVTYVIPCGTARFLSGSGHEDRAEADSG
ncbi:uncharacterized protein LOC125288033 isoform X1 [Alosa alosa]|uniref:uncharacterized protein LOC125288033 isoform X1 n=1 Tax=Alosa alosa TaxID=278164 RepID=UPI00201534C2|nr:uncharacterized protein LOC125288033 isoform X1 [Alosa alosa]